MRPRSIILFQRLYAAAILVGIVAALSLWQHSVALLTQLGVPAYVAPFSLLVGTAIPVLLLWLVAWRASDVARWVIVLIVAFGIIGLLWALYRGTYAFGLVGLLGLLRVALQVAAVATTFQPDAQAWLAPEAEPPLRDRRP